MGSTVLTIPPHPYQEHCQIILHVHHECTLMSFTFPHSSHIPDACTQLTRPSVSPDIRLQHDPLGSEAIVDQDLVEVVCGGVHEWVVIRVGQRFTLTWQVVKVTTLHRLLDQVFHHSVQGVAVKEQ